MQRRTTVLSRFRRVSEMRRLARPLRAAGPLPLSPREPVAALDALGPSLMPRTWQVQGVVMGISVLAARATNGVANTLSRAVLPAGAPLPVRLAARAAFGGAGAALATLPERGGHHF